MDTPGRFVAWSTCVLDLCRTYDIGTWCYINTDWGPLCQQEWMGDARIERASPQVQSHWKNLLLQRVTSHADADDASGVTLLVGQDNFADVRAYASAFGSNRISGLSGYSQLWSNKDVQKPQFQGDNCCAEGAYDVNQNRGNKTCYENCSQESERRYRDGTLARGLQNFDWSACNLHATPTTEQFGLLETMLDDTRYNGGKIFQLAIGLVKQYPCRSAGSPRPSEFRSFLSKIVDGCYDTNLCMYNALFLKYHTIEFRVRIGYEMQFLYVASADESEDVIRNGRAAWCNAFSHIVKQLRMNEVANVKTVLHVGGTEVYMKGTHDRVIQALHLERPIAQSNGSILFTGVECLWVPDQVDFIGFSVFTEVVWSGSEAQRRCGGPPC